MTMLHFKNFALLEPGFGELRQGYELVVEGDIIRELSDKPIKSAKADVIDCGGRTLMPGLIDSHVHVFLSEVYIRSMESMPLTLMTARAVRLMKGMLDRGFTSVRDTGGADWASRKRSRRAMLRVPACSSRARRSARPAAIAIRAGAPILARAAIAATPWPIR